MGITTIICTYIYGSFLIIKNVLEIGMQAAKTLLTLINNVVTALMTTITGVIDPAISVVINLVKVFEKKLMDMIFAINGDSIWCNKLFDCLALLNQLIDPNSFIFRMIKKAFKKECHNNSPIDDDLLNKIREWISNFDEFRKTICKYGFSFEFGISLLKELLNGFAKQLEGYIKFLDRQRKKLTKQLEKYLNFCINTGIIDSLENIMDFFLCVLDSSESCASIATASNFYSSTMSTLHLEKNGDGYDLSTSYKNKVYGSLEGCAIKCKNLKYDIKGFLDVAVNPDELNRANKAFNLSKNILPGNMKFSDFKNSDGKFSIGKLASANTWKKHTLFQKVRNIKNEATSLFAIKHNKKVSMKELINGAFVDNNGNMFYKDGCEYVKIPDGPNDTIVSMDLFIDEKAVPSDELILDPDTGELISVTLAAVRINENPDGELADRCKTIWSYVNNWQMNAEVAVHGNNVEKPI